MSIQIRAQTIQDYSSISTVIQTAFKTHPYSNHKQQYLVQRLRKSKSFIPQLSLVCLTGLKIIGYLLMTQVKIKTQNKEIPSLALGPIAVLPEFQRQGNGGKMVQTAHQKARQIGFKSVVVLGDDKYFGRFGYKPASDFLIELPFPAPKKNCMAIELQKDALKEVVEHGIVVYPQEFKG